MASRRLIRKVAVSLGGALLIVLGVIGIVTPIMPQVIFIVGGLSLLAKEFSWADRTLAALKGWFDRRLRLNRDEAEQSSNPPKAG
jgi:uncharacterized membrane protein YbaN (DUF454 family)